MARGFLRKNKTILKMADYDKINVPAMFLGRLAVDNNVLGVGVGTFLLKYCVDLAVTLNEKTVGCRFVTLITKKGYREKFYSDCYVKKVHGAPLDDDTLVMMRLRLVPKNKND